jgi:hypothetical protein
LSEVTDDWSLYLFRASKNGSLSLSICPEKAKKAPTARPISSNIRRMKYCQVNKVSLEQRGAVDIASASGIKDPGLNPDRV